MVGTTLVLGLCSALVIALVSCAPQGEPSDDPSSSIDDNDRGHHRPPPKDAREPDAPPADSGTTGGGGGGSTGGGDATTAGIVSCYLGGFPNTTCARPQHCCFSNFTSQHDGECSSTTCAWGTIDCDGPEDCATGQHCCAHVQQDPVWGITGYKIACQATACGAAPAAEELCHPSTTSASGTCSPGKSCLSAGNVDYDLPRSLSICR